ncbi:EexN family lipoprotein [Bradyrhizobium sp. LHD-71]|uniref:EexN family lipoprotein n=1 Tax=Bradyrhizobium sp. LHD-71 TaxID=3072141 RepID=UPI00280DBA50|nr:EexN family lipoprotein [Bradyrhizobium sp. LHD-71]MDQ8727533.1 EexN family lipoprotein [Bradyrhizobium sp. LHD-71]
MLAFVLMIGLTGCGDNDPQPTATTPPPPVSGDASRQPTRTVAWFIDHRAELQAILGACRDNPGDLGRTTDCINANEADDRITIQEMKNAFK